MQIISFTPAGNKLNSLLCEKTGAEGFSVKPDNALKETDLQSFVTAGFSGGVPTVFIGAAGIAVRAISAHLADKFKDPPVLVIDEKGQFVVPILSGHYGGGNALALQISGLIGAQPVITTATDVQRLFAVDVFAKMNQLTIIERELAKSVSAALLRGEKIGICCEQLIEGNFPEELVLCGNDGKAIRADKQRGNPTEDAWAQTDNYSNNLGIYIGVHKEQPFRETLHLVPRCLYTGIGCRRGTNLEKIRGAVQKVFYDKGLFEAGIFTLTSIDIKMEEAGLLAFAEEMDCPAVFFSALELEQASGNFTASSFVKNVTGTDNVCERSAVLGAGTENLIVQKTSIEGVTVAVAEKEWSVCFE